MSALPSSEEFRATRELRPREERKPSDLHGWLTRAHDESPWDFSVVDMSYGGCRIRSGAALRRGETVRLAVARKGLIEACVRWRRGESIGLSFMVEQPRPALWPRKAERFRFDCPVMVRRQGRRSQLIDAQDISTHGCCLRFTDAPQSGETMWVRLPGVESIEAETRWTRGFSSGVNFKTQIHPAVFDLILSRLEAADNPPIWSRLKV
jgi:hypothetical protein